MSADMLRRAAALMRERAQAATPGPWHPGGGIWEDTVLVADGSIVLENYRNPDAVYVSSWHPAVALAVSDWLDDLAEEGDDDYCAGSGHDEGDPCNSWFCNNVTRARAVARAYLNEESQ